MNVYFHYFTTFKERNKGVDFDFRLARFLETAGSVLNYFEPVLGRIEIISGAKRIERVYFQIDECQIEQWEKPQIKVIVKSPKITLYEMENI